MRMKCQRVNNESEMQEGGLIQHEISRYAQQITQKDLPRASSKNKGSLILGSRDRTSISVTKAWNVATETGEASLESLEDTTDRFGLKPPLFPSPASQPFIFKSCCDPPFFVTSLSSVLSKLITKLSTVLT